MCMQLYKLLVIVLACKLFRELKGFIGVLLFTKYLVKSLPVWLWSVDIWPLTSRASDQHFSSKCLTKNQHQLILICNVIGRMNHLYNGAWMLKCLVYLSVKSFRLKKICSDQWIKTCEDNRAKLPYSIAIDFNSICPCMCFSVILNYHFFLID